MLMLHILIFRPHYAVQLLPVNSGEKYYLQVAQPSLYFRGKPTANGGNHGTSTTL
jgi:hypothetical protein